MKSGQNYEGYMYWEICMQRFCLVKIILELHLESTPDETFVVA